MMVLAITLITAGVLGVAAVLLFGKVRRYEPEERALLERLRERPGSDDQFGTWPAIPLPVALRHNDPKGTDE